MIFSILTEMWNYAEAASHNPDDLEKFDFLSKSKITKNALEECYSYISEEEDRVVFVFAGTGGAKNDLKSWIKDFSAYPLKEDVLLNTKTKEKGTIHSGFYYLWGKSKSMIDEVVERTQNTKKYFVTGMSQGGAVATLCARHLVLNRKINKDNVRLVSFGAPSQGTQEYANQVDALDFQNLRIVDGYDIVPTLPPYAVGFRHCGYEIQLSVPWWHVIFYKIHDHFYSSYTKGLIKEFKKLKKLGLLPETYEDIKVLEEILKRVTI